MIFLLSIKFNIVVLLSISLAIVHLSYEIISWVNLFLIFDTGITRVFFGSDFVTLTKSDNASWDFLKPEIFAAIMDFYSSGQPLFLDSETAAAKDTAIHEVYL